MKKPKTKPAGKPVKASAKGTPANDRPARVGPGAPPVGAEPVVPVNCSTFADAVVEGMGWPPEFKEYPLLRTALEFALAWAYQKYVRGDYGMISPGNFVARAVDIADNHVTGPCDLIQWEGRPDIRKSFEGAVLTAFAATLKAEATTQQNQG